MDKVNFGDELVTPDEKTRRVGGVFTSVARSYDLMNDLMSGGMHRLWKNRFVAKVKPRPVEHILDMAGGTGDIAFRMATKGAQVTVSDINADMLTVGKERARKQGIDGLNWQVENAEQLSFADAQFDAYTIAFGIRNVTDIPAALREAHRVLKRGGRLFILEFSTSEWPGFGEIYDRYSEHDLWAYGDRAFNEQAEVLAQLEAGKLVMNDLGGKRPASLTGASPALRKAVHDARLATEQFAAWIKAEAPRRTGPSGVGKDNYNWYLSHDVSSWKSLNPGC